VDSDNNYVTWSLSITMTL